MHKQKVKRTFVRALHFSRRAEARQVVRAFLMLAYLLRQSCRLQNIYYTASYPRVAG
nr:MAG TPA: hypothetical protein [Bacteriophage sp.]